MKDKECIFCMLAGGEIPTSKIYEDDEVAVILDAGPASRGHALVMPKDHYANLAETPANLVSKLINVATRVGEAQLDALGAAGYNILVNTNEAAGQTVFHTHVHVIPRYENEESIVSWTPGKLENGPELAKQIADAM